MHAYKFLYVFICVCISCSVVSNSLQPYDCYLPGTSIHGILQARILEWVAISFSRGSSRHGKIEARSPALWTNSSPSEPPAKQSLYTDIYKHTHTHTHTYTALDHCKWSVHQLSVTAEKPGWFQTTNHLYVNICCCSVSQLYKYRYNCQLDLPLLWTHRWLESSSSPVRAGWSQMPSHRSEHQPGYHLVALVLLHQASPLGQLGLPLQAPSKPLRCAHQCYLGQSKLENHHFDMKPGINMERDPNPKDLAIGGHEWLGAISTTSTVEWLVCNSWCVFSMLCLFWSFKACPSPWCIPVFLSPQVLFFVNWDSARKPWC